MYYRRFRGVIQTFLKSWDQLIALIYAQIACATSLREIETGFNSQRIHHYHLGTRCIRRSTLADANQKRPAALFERICQLLMAKVSRHLRQEVGEFLYLLDSTPIPLKGLGYDDWTRDNHNHRTQGLKVHVLMASGSNTPVQSLVSAPNINDIDVGRNMPIETGQTYVFDKGYCEGLLRLQLVVSDSLRGGLLCHATQEQCGCSGIG